MNDDEETYGGVVSSNVFLLFWGICRALALLQHGTTGNRSGVTLRESAASLTGHHVLVQDALCADGVDAHDGVSPIDVRVVDVNDVLGDGGHDSG